LILYVNFRSKKGNSKDQFTHTELSSNSNNKFEPLTNDVKSIEKSADKDKKDQFSNTCDSSISKLYV